MMLVATGIEVHLGERAILRGIDLELAPGELVALVGPNGAGKTTFVRALSGLIDISAGSVRVDALDVHRASRRDVARCIALVPQSRPPVFEFSVMEFVLMGCHARSSRFGLESAKDRERAERFLADAELSEFVTRSVGTLSAGEFQRALLVRTRLTEAPIWLLDEPTANLDPRHELNFLEMLKAHTQAGGSALTVLHDLRQASRWFDRVIVMAGGEIVREGVPEHALSESVLSEVYGLPMRRVSTEHGFFFDPVSPLQDK